MWALSAAAGAWAGVKLGGGDIADGFEGAGAGLPGFVWPAALAIFSLLLIVLLICWRWLAKWGVGYVPISVVVCAELFSLGGMAASGEDRSFIAERRVCRMSGIVETISKRDSASVGVIVKVDSLWAGEYAAEDVKGLISVPCEALTGAEELRPGMHIDVSGHTKVPFADRYSDFDYLEYLRSQGLSFIAEATECRVDTAAEGNGSWLATCSGRLSDAFSRSLAEVGVSRESVAFLRALVFADRSELSPEVRSAFAACGTSHVLAVSGLHVGILAMSVAWLLGRFVRRRWAVFVSVVLIWFYALVVGMSPPIVRAAVMFSFIAIGGLLGYHPASFHSLCAAMLVIVLVDPLSVMEAGFWLSFLAVGGLLAALSYFERWPDERPPVVKWGSQCVIVSVVAQVATLPVLVGVFHSLPTYFWFNNLVVVEPIKWIFVGALLCPVVCHVPIVGSAVGWVVDGLLRLVMRYCCWAASLPYATVDEVSLSSWGLAALVAVVGSFFFFLRERNALSVRMSLASVACFAVAVACEEVTRHQAVEPFSRNGVVGVGVTADGRYADFVVEEPESDNALRAVRAVCSARRWRLRSVVGSDENCLLVSDDGWRVYVVNEGDTQAVPQCDACVINADAVVCVSDSVGVVFTPRCLVRGIY